MDASTMFWVGAGLILLWMFRGLVVLLVIAIGGALLTSLVLVGALVGDGCIYLWRATKKRGGR